MLAKLKEYVIHFLVSCLILVGVGGYVKYRVDMQHLQEQLYQAGKAGTLVIAKTPDRTLLEKLQGKKKLVVPPSVPRDSISRVIEVHTSTNCPTATVVVTRDGSIVASTSTVTRIFVEDYDKELFYKKLDLRLTGLAYPRRQGFSGGQDVGLQASYWHFWRLHPDATVSTKLIGIGISLSPEIPYLENLYLGGGYAYHFRDNYYVPYGSASLKFGK